jgi:hypothetical protein
MQLFNYRVRLRFTVWRFLLAMACFCLVLGMIHDAQYTKQGEIPWSFAVGALIVSLPLAAMLIAPWGQT